ncbi:amidase [Caldimonas tepidiphila]|uniref:amidase n=1 Tax=Caldimonas tepidiphila TaxID=2315841 RepID=UPI000E5A34AD|nr:amidase [Caldimonas tepidiphila]
MLPDLLAARDELRAGRTRAVELLAQSEAQADTEAVRPAFLRRFPVQARAAALAADAALDAGIAPPPLAGLAVSVKDLFDVEGMPTTAGSRVLEHSPPAARDAGAVQRLRRAGAALVGHTHMSEFAFSGVGTNPHHATPANPGTRLADPHTPRIPGGSSSGGAVSVAAGAAWAALGSDTGGSIRIPAALQGLVGFKSTARLTPLDGTIPLSPTLDTACAITRSVRDAALLHEVLSQQRVAPGGRPLSGWNLAVARSVVLEALDATVARAFERTLQTLARRGARITEIELPELAGLADVQARGSFAAAESWAWHQPLLAARRADYDPRVALRIERGATMSAADYIGLLQGRAQAIGRVTQALRPFDAVLSPTVPIVAPPLAGMASDEEFFRVNALLLRNPALVNLLDGCALSLPCHRADELPVGLMVWAGALQDERVLDIGLAIEAALAARED